MNFGGRSPPPERKIVQKPEQNAPNPVQPIQANIDKQRKELEPSNSVQGSSNIPPPSLKNSKNQISHQDNDPPSNVQSGSKMSSNLPSGLSSVQGSSKIPPPSLKNSRNQVNIDPLSNVQSGSKMTSNQALGSKNQANQPDVSGPSSGVPSIIKPAIGNPPLSLKNSQNFPDRQFQNDNYINYNRGSGFPRNNSLCFDQSSDIFDAINMGKRDLSSTRRQTIMEDELLRSTEMVAEERLRIQNEKLRIDKQRLVNDRNQNKLIQDMKNMVEVLQVELAAARSSIDKNNTSVNTDELSSLMTMLLNNTTASSSKIVGPNEKRHKVLESIAKNPIDQWQYGVSGNLYVFLRFKAEPYLKSKSFTKAETAQAIGGIFSQSHYAEEKAIEICLQNLPDHPEKLDDRIDTYKKIARELDENGGITIEPLNSQERVIDLFLRCKLILECELDGDQIEKGSLAEAKLNHRAIKRMLNKSENLLPDIDQEKIAALWNSMQVSLDITDSTNAKGSIKTEQAVSLFNYYDSMRILRMQNDLEERPKQAKELATKRENAWSKPIKECEVCGRNQHTAKDCPLVLYGPCEKCLADGIPRNKIRHTARNHKYDRNPNNGTNHGPANKFGPPPPSLQKYNNKSNFNMMSTNEIEQQKSERVITMNEQGYPCIRIEVDESIVEIILDTGCLFEGVIENSMVEKLNLQKYRVKDSTTVCFANGSKTLYDSILEVPVRFKDTAVCLKVIVMEKLPAKFLLGTPGMQKLGMNIDISNQKNL